MIKNKLFYIIFLAGLFLFIQLILHIPTARGEHVGYITAVQTKGFIIRTGSAFFKTDARSSSEYQYCVIGINLYKRLAQHANQNDKIIITYHRQLYIAPWHCNGEKDIIDNVKSQS